MSNRRKEIIVWPRNVEEECNQELCIDVLISKITNEKERNRLQVGLPSKDCIVL